MTSDLDPLGAREVWDPLDPCLIWVAWGLQEVALSWVRTWEPQDPWGLLDPLGLQDLLVESFADPFLEDLESRQM